VVEEDEAPPPAKKPQRRKMNFATPKRDEDSITIPKRTTRRTTRASLEKAREEEQDDSVEMVGASSSVNGTARTPEDTSKNSTKIALPFSDTPVINRNKELRKKGTGGRRSSLGLRGRRASSLIDNGHSAIPHQQVETSQFYKHIEAEGLSEPRRMKQLLTWCGERALGEKPSHNIEDSAAVLAGMCSFWHHHLRLETDCK
jgi:kinetochore protein Mis13/DSN1